MEVKRNHNKNKVHSPYMHYSFAVQYTYRGYRTANYIENGCSCEMDHCKIGYTHSPAPL